jgi:hypothetical protein
MHGVDDVSDQDELALFAQAEAAYAEARRLVFDVEALSEVRQRTAEQEDAVARLEAAEKQLRAFRLELYLNES